MKRDALLSFKTSQEMREAVEKLAREGDRSVSMQLNKIIREWFEEHAQPPPPNKPQKSSRA